MIPFLHFRNQAVRTGFLLACLAFLAQCLKENTTPPFEIRVVNIKNGDPIENAEITFVGQKLSTNSKGIASFQAELDRFLLDRLVISVDAAGYFSHLGNVLIGKDQQETVIIELTPENGLIYEPNPVVIFENETERFVEITNLGVDSISCKVTIHHPWIILDTTKLGVSPSFPHSLRIRTNDANQSCRQEGFITVSWRSTGKPDTVRVVKIFPDKELPTAAFVLIPASTIIIQNTAFELDASNSTDNCSPGVPLLYRWSFSNGQNFGNWGTTPQTTHFYPSPGAYTITLQVKDGGNNISSSSINVTVQEEPTPPVLADLMTAADGPELLSATLTGNLLSFGQTYTSLLEWGFVWTTGTHDPSREGGDNFTQATPQPAQIGNFSILAQNLPPQKIRIRAYAHNGTLPREYSNTIEFTPKVVDFRLINPNCVGNFTAQRGTNNSSAPVNEKPSSTVQLGCFLLSETEVTNEQYAAYLTHAQSGEAEINIAASGIEKIGTKYRAMPGQEKYPVTHLSWQGAKNFCNWLVGSRLPTEAEWEAAARTGTQNQDWPVFSGTNNPDPSIHVVYNQPSLSLVGGAPGVFRLPNPWGLYDMSGNVEEWCNDFYAPQHTPGPNGPPTGDQRVVRGGKFNDPTERVTTTARRGEFPSLKVQGLGFRVAKSL